MLDNLYEKILEHCARKIVKRNSKTEMLYVKRTITQMVDIFFCLNLLVFGFLEISEIVYRVKQDAPISERGLIVRLMSLVLFFVIYAVINTKKEDYKKFVCRYEQRKKS